jgi:hypothetical protein
MKQIAVEWLVNQIAENLGIRVKNSAMGLSLLDQAKEMEQEQKKTLLNFIEETRDLCNKLQMPTEQEILELKRKANIILTSYNTEEQ